MIEISQFQWSQIVTLKRALIVLHLINLIRFGTTDEENEAVTMRRVARLAAKDFLNELDKPTVRKELVLAENIVEKLQKWVASTRVGI
jgi:hypothetical protein